MSIQDVALPYDIAWELIATSDDMIANHDKRFPHAMWKSSLAVFAYDPDPDTDLPDELKAQHRALTYLKVVCSITSYLPSCEECPPPPAPATGEDYGSNQANLEAWRQQCQIVSEVEHRPYACSGALIQIAIYPKVDPAATTYDPKTLAYFASFEPKKRELIEVGTESGESITSSKSDVNVRKGTTATNSTDNYDVLTGVSAGGGFAGASAQVGVTGNWGTIKKSGSESVNVTTSDSSRDLREGSSHTTNISNLYHLLNSYHLGTNRAIFFVQPRPHTLQQKEQYTFIDGPQEIEGIQEFFLIVSRPDDLKLEDYCIDALLYTAHLDDDASAKALNDPKTAETSWIEFSAIAAKIDDGGHSIWNIEADVDQAATFLIDQAENALHIWGGGADPAATPAKVHPPATIDGYLTPTFITQADNLTPTALLTHDDLINEQWVEALTPGSNSGWKIDRSRGLGGYDLWEDPNNSSGVPTGDKLATAPPEAFVDIVSLNTPDDLQNYLPDYGLRVRAQAWPSTVDTTMYHGRIKGYFIRNDMASNQRTIDMFVTVRGVSTCDDSPFFNNAPDKAILVVPDIAAENHINPRNVSPWKANTGPEKTPNFTSIQDPGDQTKQILLSNPRGNSVPSGMDHQILGAARAKMANMIGKQVVQSMNSSLSCLAERTDGTLTLQRYAFRQSDFFFNNVAGKMMGMELQKFAPQVSKDPALAAALANHSRAADIQAQVPALGLLKSNYNAHVLKVKKETEKAAAIARKNKAAGTPEPAKKKIEQKKPAGVKAEFPLLTLSAKHIEPAHKKMLTAAGFQTSFDLVGIQARELATILGTDEQTVRTLRLQVLGINPSKAGQPMKKSAKNKNQVKVQPKKQ